MKWKWGGRNLQYTQTGCERDANSLNSRNLNSLKSSVAAPPAGAFCPLTPGLILCFFRFCQHQRPEHAGKAGQRGGGDRGGLGDGGLCDGRKAVQGGKIRPAAPARVLQVLKNVQLHIRKAYLKHWLLNDDDNWKRTFSNQLSNAKVVKEREVQSQPEWACLRLNPSFRFI